MCQLANIRSPFSPIIALFYLNVKKKARHAINIQTAKTEEKQQPEIHGE